MNYHSDDENSSEYDYYEYSSSRSSRSSIEPVAVAVAVEPIKDPVYRKLTLPGNLLTTQQQIQKTVRVQSSLYQNDLSALTIFQPASTKTRVNWNQMSDRAVPHGSGVDIKHNSYSRYIGRLKGKYPVRSQPIPKTFGKPVPFVPAMPFYGNKMFKAAIIMKTPATTN
jgi:hypothetical protein